MLLHAPPRSALEAGSDDLLNIVRLSAPPLVIPDGAGFCACGFSTPEADGDVPSSLIADSARIDIPPDLARAVGKRRAEFLVGRLCAISAARELGQALPAIPRGTYGEPVWPTGVVGSISHCDGMACAIVADGSQLPSAGIDLEPVYRQDDLDRLREQVCSETEIRSFRDWCGSDAEAFTTIFSAKEAVYKFLHPIVRRFVDFDEVRLAPQDDNAITGTLAEGLSRQSGFKTLAVSAATWGSHVLTLCVGGRTRAS